LLFENELLFVDHQSLYFSGLLVEENKEFSMKVGYRWDVLIAAISLLRGVAVGQLSADSIRL
jgi:hypothetical protein